jgi:hypothetical protein
VQLLPIFEERLDDGGQLRANYRHLCQTASRFLTKLLNFGDEVFDLCSNRVAASERAVDRIPLALARHNAAQLDSLSVLLGSGTVDGCPSLLRSILDATFGIAHIAQDRHEERALAYQLARMKRHIKHLRRGDRTHPDGQQLEADLATDVFVPGVLSKLPSGLAEKAAECERQIQARPEFVPILAEWERLKRPEGRRTQKDPEWYTLFGGAKDIRALAKQLNWQSLYDFFYRDWSNAAHAGNVLENYTTADNRLRPLRYPAGYTKAFSFAFALYINALEKLAGFYNATMAQQVRDHVVRALNPEHERIVGQFEKAIGVFK